MVVAVPVTEVRVILNCPVSGFLTPIQFSVPLPVEAAYIVVLTSEIQTDVHLVSTLPDVVIVFVAEVRSVVDHRIVEVNPTIDWVNGNEVLNVLFNIRIINRVPPNVVSDKLLLITPSFMSMAVMSVCDECVP